MKKYTTPKTGFFCKPKAPKPNQLSIRSIVEILEPQGTPSLEQDSLQQAKAEAAKIKNDLESKNYLKGHPSSETYFFCCNLLEMISDMEFTGFLPALSDTARFTRV